MRRSEISLSEGHRPAFSLCCMAILIDNAHWPRWDRMWCHLVSDTSLEELHAFARRMEIPERGFGGDHYDLPEEYRARAIELGAMEVSSQEIVRRLRAAGLRNRIPHQP